MSLVCIKKDVLKNYLLQPDVLGLYTFKSNATPVVQANRQVNPFLMQCQWKFFFSANWQ